MLIFKPIMDPILGRVFGDYTTNYNLLTDTNANRMLVLLQQLFHYSSIDNLTIYPQFIR
jgi:hypothetical protein